MGDICAVMWSGGKDSEALYQFLCANKCNYPEFSYQNAKIIRLMCDTGTHQYNDTVNQTHKAMVDFRDDYPYYHEISSKQVAHILRTTLNQYGIEEYNQFGNIYPALLNCFICQLAMIVSVINYCKVRNVSTVFHGSRPDQSHLPNHSSVCTYYWELFAKYTNSRVSFFTPLHNKKILDHINQFGSLYYGHISWTEPQCTIGAPFDKPLTDADVKPYLDLAKTWLEPVIDRMMEYNFCINEKVYHIEKE